jgi:chemotaxis protein CheC
MTETRTLSDFHFDALKEIGNIGIGHATTSLSQMVNRRVDISLPDLKLIPFSEVSPLVKKEDPVVGIVLELKGDAEGYLLLLLSKNDAKSLIKLIVGEVSDNDSFDEMEESVLKELGNIMTGTYVTALSDFLGLSLGLSTPSQVYDMADAIVNDAIGSMNTGASEILFMNTEFMVKSEQLDGKLLIFTDSSSISRILDAINRMTG